MLSGEVKKPDGYCAACRKHFNTEGAFENHLKSKKHRESAAAFDKRKDKVQGDPSGRLKLHVELTFGGF